LAVAVLRGCQPQALKEATTAIQREGKSVISYKSPEAALNESCSEARTFQYKQKFCKA